MQAAVTSSGSQCSSVGMEMLIMNGSAVDAAIATLLCEGVSSLERSVSAVPAYAFYSLNNCGTV